MQELPENETPGSQFSLFRGTGLFDSRNHKTSEGWIWGWKQERFGYSLRTLEKKRLKNTLSKWPGPILNARAYLAGHTTFENYWQSNPSANVVSLGRHLVKPHQLQFRTHLKSNEKKVISCDWETIEVLASHLLKAEPSWFVTRALPNFLAPAAKSKYWFLQCAGVVKKSLIFQQILYNSRTLLESIFKLKQCNRHFAQTSEVSSSWFSFQGKVWYRLSPALLPENCYFGFRYCMDCNCSLATALNIGF